MKNMKHANFIFEMSAVEALNEIRQQLYENPCDFKAFRDSVTANSGCLGCWLSCRANAHRRLEKKRHLYLQGFEAHEEPQNMKLGR